MKWTLIGIIVAATTVGEVLQAFGMRHHGEIRDFRPGALGRAMAVLPDEQPQPPVQERTDPHVRSW